MHVHFFCWAMPQPRTQCFCLATATELAALCSYVTEFDITLTTQCSSNMRLSLPRPELLQEGVLLAS